MTCLFRTCLEDGGVNFSSTMDMEKKIVGRGDGMAELARALHELAVSLRWLAYSKLRTEGVQVFGTYADEEDSRLRKEMGLEG